MTCKGYNKKPIKDMTKREKLDYDYERFKDYRKRTRTTCCICNGIYNNATKRVHEGTKKHKMKLMEIKLNKINNISIN